MLEIVRYNRDEYNFPCLLVLGCFDGLHIGHAELLKKAKLQAKINGLDLGVMMFSDGKDGGQVFTFDERVKFLEKFNAKFVLKIDFTDEFKATPALDFLKNIEDKLNVKAYMSGKDFRFGAQAKGKSSTLKKYAEDEDNGVWYMPVKDVLDGGKKIGTSDIKAMLAGGDILNANRLLGRNFSVSGTVIRGANRGTGVLGFPTMNIEYPAGKVKIKQGVYTVECKIGENVYGGIANYGARPTFGEDNALLEVHLNGFNGDLYGQTVTVEFVSYIRDIQKFNSAEELKAQLKRDFASLGGGEVTDAETVAESEKEAVNEQPAEAVGAGICADEREITPVEATEETVVEAGTFVEEEPVPTVTEVPEEEKTDGQAENEEKNTDGEKID